MFMLGVGTYMGMALVNRLAQTPVSEGYGFGASLPATGLLLLPMAGGSLLSHPTRAWLARALGPRWVVPTGSAIAACGLGLLAAEHAHVALVVLFIGVMALGAGCAFASMPVLIIDNVPYERTGSAAGVNQVMLLMGGALGSAFGITLLAAHRAAGHALPLEEGYTVALAVSAIACVAAAAGSAALRPSKTELDVNINRLDTYGRPMPEESATIMIHEPEQR
jgi:dipeptide/tripeptide permease